jgi:MFS family permease
VASLVYCVTYILSCFTKHSPNYWVLMVGRLLGGIATSLLFSAFESWLVAEHFKRGFEGAWLSEVFSKAIFLGNGVVAIASGLIANFLVTNMEFGPVAPFDAAAVFLAIGAVIIFATWPENYGDNTSASSQSIVLQFQRAANTIKSDPKIFLLGAMQSLFEGSMYTFVFLWTPALSPNGEKIPHGFIFACFMVACMIGSSLASRLLQASERGGVPVEKYMRWVFATASFSLFLPVLLGFLGLTKGQGGDGLSFAGKILFLGFLVFEVTVGIFWPSLMKLRSQLIPEESRSTIMNFFRIPLNLFVCVVLYNVSAFEMGTMFIMCSAFLGLCAVLSDRLTNILKSSRLQAPGKGYLRLETRRG